MPKNGCRHTKITIFISSVMASIDQKSLQAFTELIIERMKEISSDWKKAWIGSSGKTGLPQNLTGRTYNGVNAFMLYLLTEVRKYNLPVYLTFNQARNEGLLINKDSKSFPVVYWNITVKDRETGKTIPLEQYNALREAEKEKYKTIPYMKHYNVFNIDQTNLKEIKPEVYEALENKFYPEKKLDDRGMFTYPPLDKMVDNDLWIVPIKPTCQDEAYYSHASNSIVVPLKAQFQDGESYYDTILHEMAHSTGKPLEREMGSILDRDKYGREELVAELTAAVTLQNIGVASTIRESNVQYLKSWLHNIKEEPSFLFNVLSDVGKASGMIQEEIDKVIRLEQEEVMDILGQKNETDLAIKLTDEYISFEGTGWNDKQKELFNQSVTNVRTLNTISKPELAAQLTKALVERDFETMAVINPMVEQNCGLGNPDYKNAEQRYHDIYNKMPAIWELNEDDSVVKCADEIFFNMRIGKASPTELNKILDQVENFLENRELETALSSARQGTFQPLLDLKEKGFQPDEKQIEKLRTVLDSKGRTIAGTIFQISIEPKPVVKPAIIENKNTVKQLTLNF